jgi:RNA polymerase sigma factor (sigma-70 family)
MHAPVVIPLTRESLVLALKDPSIVEPDAGKRLELEFREIYGPVIEKWCRRVLPLNPVDAELASTFVMNHVVSKLRTYDRQAGLFRSWLFTVVKHAALDFGRKHPRLVPAGSISWADSIESKGSEADLDEALDGSARHRQLELLERALPTVKASVTPEKWAVFERRALFNEPYLDIAADLKKKVSELHVIVSRVTDKLRREVERLASESEAKS